MEEKSDKGKRNLVKNVILDLGRLRLPLKVPGQTDVLSMNIAPPLPHPEKTIRRSLADPIDSPPLKTLIFEKLRVKPEAQAVVVISDHTRPVPYSGESGILFPVVDEMIKAGLDASRILLLVATGTHRAMDAKELRGMLDPRLFSLGLRIINHDSRSQKDMVSVGQTDWGGDIFINRYYVESDIKILTGLVESHFMAGVSGGRKSICPGLMAEPSTHILHSGPVLASPHARDLILDRNPVHEEASKVARMAGCDMILNVTLDSDFRLTGIFAGDMEQAFRAAYEKLMSYAAIPVAKKYDIVLSHTGYVGVNHYQAAKGALTCVPVVKEGGICLLAAHHTDPDPVGGPNYKKMMRFLNKVGRDKFLASILDPGWDFVPEQWEAQMWTRLFHKIPPEHLVYCTLDIPEESFSWLPGLDARSIAPRSPTLQELVETVFAWARTKLQPRLGRVPRAAVLLDGPYGIPLAREEG
jgi:nickel-dependent lactate racemase